MFPPPSIFFKLMFVGMALGGGVEGAPSPFFFHFVGFREEGFVIFVFIVVGMVWGGGKEGTCEKGSVNEKFSKNSLTCMI